jgi:hypothetical protein
MQIKCRLSGPFESCGQAALTHPGNGNAQIFAHLPPMRMVRTTDVDRAIEIRLASGVVIRVGREVEIEPLQRLLRALGQ